MQEREEEWADPEESLATVARIVEAVLRGMSRQDPADALLRVELKRQRNLLPDFGRRAAEALFACLRWRGWLDTENWSVRRQVAEALERQERFERESGAFSGAELIQRAVPEWAGALLAGPVGADQSAWARSLQRRPRLWLRARVGQRDLLASKLRSVELPEGALLPEALEYLGQEDLFMTPEFHAGEFEIQDIASQAVARICAPQPGQTWWDVCAGEGGKTLYLGDQMQNKGLIWATDRAEWRLQRLKRRAGRAGMFNYRMASWDGSRAMRTRFDGILLDAPCSGLGTWQRNPHARWTTTPADVTELAAVQGRLLGHSARALKKGGRLVYAVCTLTKAETVEVVERFQEEFPELQPQKMQNPLRQGEPPSEQVWLQPRDGGNGMFLASWLNPA